MASENIESNGNYLLIDGKPASLHYRKFVDEILQPTYQTKSDQYESVKIELAQYEILKTHLEILNKRKVEKQPFSAMVHLGQGIHFKGVAEDLNRICVKIGLDYHVELSLKEAEGFIEKKQAHLSRKLKDLETKLQKITLDLNQATAMVSQLSELEAEEL